MAVVSAFGILNGTQNAGMTAYYRAPDCNSVTIADVLPILSKIDYYEDEYVIGEMLIWDSGSQSYPPNNCVMVRVIVYNDGWICVWFDKLSQNQLGTGGCGYVNQDTLNGFGSGVLGYINRYNACQLKVTGSDDGVGNSDPDCPDGTIHTIMTTDYDNGQITTVRKIYNESSYHNGYTYNTEIYMSNGNLVWTGTTVRGYQSPPYNSNRLYRAIYQIWNEILDSSNSSNKVNGGASLVYRYNHDDESYTNVTTDFNDDGANDCQVFPNEEEIDDAFYIGYSRKYSGINITMGTDGIGSGVTWEYWDGSTWNTLSLIDGTSGFTGTGEITFDPPDDWSGINLTLGNYYWVRARVTTALYITTPIITQGQVYIQNDIGYTETELGLYNFEYTSANYVLLCGSYEPGGGIYYYNTVLPGKIVYDDVVYIGGNVLYDHYGYSYCYAYINGIKVFNLSAAQSNQNGHVNMDNIHGYTVGTQNTFYIKRARLGYITIASVITVS